MASQDTEMLLRGAGRIVEMREAQRRAAREKRGGQQLAADEVSSMLEKIAPTELRNTGLEDNSEIEAAFGRDQSDYQNFGPGDNQYVGPDADFERARRMEAMERPQSGAAGVREALTRLEAAQSGQNPLRRAFSGIMGGEQSASNVAGRLEDSLDQGRTLNEADASLGRETVRRDSARFSPSAQRDTYKRSAADAEAIARDLFTVGGRGAIADASMKRIPGSGFANFEDAAVVEGQYVDPRTGTPISQAEPVTTAIAGSNTPGSSQALNAPQQETAVSYVANQINPEAGSIYAGRQLAQQDLTGITSDFSERVQKLGTRKAFQGTGLSNVSGNIRSMAELEGTVAAIRGVMGPDTSVQGVMRKLGLSPAEEQRLAQAMFQLSAAQEGSRNASYYARQAGPRTGAEVFYNSAAALPSAGLSETDTQVAQVLNQKIEGQDVATAFRNIQNPDGSSVDPSSKARFIGQVEGEKPRVNRFNSTGTSDPQEIENTLRIQAESRARRDRKPVDQESLRSNITKAKLVEARESRDNTRRADQMSAIIENLPPISRRSYLRGV